jgi:hypothetical protein
MSAISLIKVPMAVYAPYGDTPVGSVTLNVYTATGAVPPTSVVDDDTPVASVTLNLSTIAKTTVFSSNWADHDISESGWTRFELASPITIDPSANDYCFSLTFADMVSVGENQCVLYIGAFQSEFQSHYFYDFDNQETGSPGWQIFYDGGRYWGFKVYDAAEVEIGSVDIDGTHLNAIIDNVWFDPDVWDSEEIGYVVALASSPLKPTTPFPASAATGVDTGLTAFSWTDGGGYGTSYYEVYFDNGTGTLPSTPTATVYTEDFIVGLSLQPNSNYQWRVDAVNAYGTTTGDTWTFATEATAFYVPQLTQAFVWLSQTGDYENFKTGNNDADAFELGIPSTDEIRWVESLESLLVGTASDEWKIGSNKLETPLSPTNFGVKQMTTRGSAKMQPVKYNDVILFVDYVKRKIYEMTFAADQDKYVSPDMTALAEHITESGIVCMAHQKNPESMLWCVLTDGSLISLVYDREQNVIAWSDHPIDGTVQSVCVAPRTNEDKVTISVTRTIEDTEKVYIESVATRIPQAIADSYFLDSFIIDTGTSATISGLDHLEGKTVAALVDGAYDGTYTVSSGAITTTTTPTTKTIVGLPYTSVLQPMRIVQNSQAGSSLGANTRIQDLKVIFLNTAGVQYGDRTTNLFSFNFDDERLEDAAYITGLFSGDVPVNMPGGFSTENPILITTNQPYPLTIKAIVASFMQTGR